MATMQPKKAGSFHLEVPLDASSVEDFSPDMPVKVALVRGEDTVLAATTVKLDAKGQGVAAFALDQTPAGARIVVGPGDAEDKDLPHLQTISRALSARALREVGPRLKLAPIVITSYYWIWWRRWCRTFVIRGRLVCPDGSPVPGATVCAYDVDWWWWWSSSQQVGCATTDASGSFTIRFRWCCGWWPWWWWRMRHWVLEPRLVDRITPLLKGLRLRKPPIPNPQPSLAVFDELVAENGVSRFGPEPQVDPASLAALRPQLLERLSGAIELEKLRIWPWWPWQPWWDCTPDIIFKATQRCGGEERVIVDESVWDARWDIPTNLVVTLVAGDNACCINDTPPPEGNCVVVASVCGSLLSAIGGNPGAAPAPVGYRSPGLVATAGDRPFAGTVSIVALFGNTANVDYYEFEWAPAPAGPWAPLPPAAAGGVSRSFWGPALPAGPVGTHPASFPFQVVGGRLVAESREHFEATNDPGSWGLTRFWLENRDLLINWQTQTAIPDGTWYLRVAGYALIAPDTLGPQQILPLCDTEDDNGLAITIDNSTSVQEPAADIVDVRINGVSAGPCSNIDASAGGVLEVDFIAYDVDEHLAYYSLIATYGEDLAVNLLTATGATLAPIGLLGVPAADFVGPDYGAARVDGAASPHWRAGGLRLTVPDLRNAFPETCCYQLELRVYKRTIVSCNYNYTPDKLTYYSLTVVV